MRRFYSRSLHRTLVLALCCMLGAGGLHRGRAEDAVPKDDKPRQTYSPETEEKIRNYFEKLVVAKQKYWVKQLDKEAERIAKTTSLDNDGVASLHTAAEKVAQECTGPWRTKLDDAFRKESHMDENQVNEMMDEVLPQMDMMVQNDFVSDYVHPLDHPAWTEAVQHLLKPEQLVLWEKAETERKEEIKKKTDTLLKMAVDRVIEQYKPQLGAKASSIRLFLALTKERADQLNDLAKNVIETSAEGIRARSLKNLFGWSEEQINALAKSRAYYLSFEAGDLASQRKLWDEGVAKILTPDELKEIHAMEETRTLRMQRGTAKMILAEMDRKVAFTTDQREKLEPIMERVVQERKSTDDDNMMNQYTEYSSSTLFGIAAWAKEEEIRQILDETQWKHWKEVTAPDLTPNPRRLRRVVRMNQAPPVQQAPLPDDADKVENGISDFLHDLATSKRHRMEGELILKVEDLCRVVSVKPEVKSLLMTAARGATEESMAEWKTSMEENVRSLVATATAQNIKQRLASIEDYQLQRDGSEAGNQGVWTSTLNKLVTPLDRKAWEKEVDGRNAYRVRAIASMLMVSFDQRVGLTPEQNDQLEPKVVGFLKEYRTDIENYFSSQDESGWYLQSYYMFIPFAGMQDTELKTVLEKEQMDRWTALPEASNCNSYWDNLKRNHEERVKLR